MTRTLEDFAGRWRMSRQIDDAKAGGTGIFDGIATLTPGADGLVYEEAGELRLPEGTNMRATRKYLWQQGRGAVRVLFDDGRDFHRIDILSEIATSFHDCPPDQYEVSYNFTRWPEWRSIWTVRGPRKNYVMTTDYRRA